ncbi:MAG: TetR/AcrR family transcriptional regulator [Rhodobacteraceae bacterium]|nr:TetR/AcrR family transcriptional regulator [Paracoccaceae bacterium]
MEATTNRDPRTIEILGKIKTVFAQKGFDGASMQDLSRAAGMSAGNFYRYFPSKNAIIEAMVELDLSDVGEIFRHILASEDPRTTFLAALRAEMNAHTQTCDGPLWAEIEAASARRPEIGEIHCRIEQGVIRYLIRTFALIGGLAEREAEARFSGHAALIMIIFKGVAMQPNADAALIDLSVATVDALLPETAGPAATRISDMSIARE